MELDPKIAQNIVDSLKNVVLYDINMFDVTGKTVASTNHRRIGKVHQGALISAQTKQSVTIENDEDLKGSKKGINIPVMFNDSVAAIIGITGKIEEVRPYGTIIKKMTEILLKEHFLQLTNFNRTSNYKELVELLLEKKKDEGLVNYLSSILEIDLRYPRCIAIGRLAFHTNTTEVFLDSNRVSTIIADYLRNEKNSFFSVSNYDIYLFLDETNQKRNAHLINLIQHKISVSTSFNVDFGVGKMKKDYTMYFESGVEARTALEWLEFEKKSSFFCQKNTLAFFTDLDQALLFSHISKENALSLQEKVFQQLSVEEINFYQKIFIEYVKENGSITKGADNLFIHKNTFQNKLNQLHTKTGYNPRDLKDFAILYMAFVLRDYWK